MYKTITIFLLLFITVNVALTQNTIIPNRTLSFYLTSYSGNLTKNTNGDSRMFSGNEFEMGAIYSQNFTSANWLSIWVKALVITGTMPKYEDDKYVGNRDDGYGILEDYGEPQAQVGLNFGNYSLIAMDTRGLVVNENYYPLDFGAKGKLTFISILEFFAIPMIGTLQDERSSTKVLNLFALRIDYSINIIDSLLFRTKLSARFYGTLGENEDALTAQRFFENAIARFENQLVWTVDKFYLWGQLRYDIANLTSNLKVDHRLGVEAGLGYAFNLSKN